MIAAALGEQSAATTEISRNVQEAMTGSLAVTRTIGGVSNDAKVTGEAALTLLRSVRGLSGETARLDGSIERFLREAHAA